jgi:hypothetical protein
LVLRVLQRIALQCLLVVGVVAAAAQFVVIPDSPTEICADLSAGSEAEGKEGKELESAVMRLAPSAEDLGLKLAYHPANDEISPSHWTSRLFRPPKTQSI